MNTRIKSKKPVHYGIVISSGTQYAKAKIQNGQYQGKVVTLFPEQCRETRRDCIVGGSRRFDMPCRGQEVAVMINEIKDRPVALLWGSAMGYGFDEKGELAREPKVALGLVEIDEDRPTSNKKAKQRQFDDGDDINLKEMTQNESLPDWARSGTEAYSQTLMASRKFRHAQACTGIAR